MGFIEQKRELQEAVREQPKPLAYDTPADVVRNVFPGSLRPTLAGFKSSLVCWQVSVDAGGQLSVEAIGLAEQRALRFDSPVELG